MSCSCAFSKRRPTDPEFWTVMNELPDPLPVSKAEIDVIEQYFGDLLDEVFGNNPSKLQAGTTYQEGDKR